MQIFWREILIAWRQPADTTAPFIFLASERYAPSSHFTLLTSRHGSREETPPFIFVITRRRHGSFSTLGPSTSLLRRDEVHRQRRGVYAESHCDVWTTGQSEHHRFGRIESHL
jgi:hypothetical protein